MVTRWLGASSCKQCLFSKVRAHFVIFLLNVDKLSCKHLDSKHFYLEMVNLLWSAGCSDVLWLCGHTDVNCDLKVVFLLANKSLIGCRVVEAFICVHVVGRWRPGKDSSHSYSDWDIGGLLQQFDREKKYLVSLLTVSDSCCRTKCSTVLAYMVPTSAAGMIPLVQQPLLRSVYHHDSHHHHCRKCWFLLTAPQTQIFSSFYFLGNWSITTQRDSD